MRWSRFRLTALTVALALGVGGCGGSSSGPKTVKVEGVVTLDGQPLAGATVRFVPVGDRGTGAYALANEDGSFRLSTQSGLDGAVPGDYKVVITLPAAENITGPADPEEAMRMAAKIMREEASKKKKGAAKGAKKPSLLPPEYSDEGRTPLKITVPPPEGKVTLNLQSRKS